MPDPWLPGADRDHRWTQNPMSGNTASRRVVLHTTESPPGTTDPRSVADYMLDSAGNASGYHVLMPLTDRYAPLQLRPADKAAGSLRNSGATPVSPNKQGSLLITVSAVGYARDAPFAHDPGPWWPRVLAWLRTWGVPDWWLGAVPSSQLQPMPLSLWESGTGGWCAHSTVPAVHNASSHWDPGAAHTAVVMPPARPSGDPDMILVRDPDGQIHLLGLSGTAHVADATDLDEIGAALRDPGHVATVGPTTWRNLQTDPGSGVMLVRDEHGRVWAVRTDLTSRVHVQAAADLTGLLAAGAREIVLSAETLEEVPDVGS